MANTFSKLASATVGSGGSTVISFNSIPQNYTDLCLKISARTNYPNSTNHFDSLALTFNSSLSQYRQSLLYTFGGAVYNYKDSADTSSIFTVYLNSSSTTTNSFGNSEVYIPNYTSNKNKVFSSESCTESNSGNPLTGLNMSLWQNTNAINSIQLTATVGYSFVQYSTATLYGIRAEV